MYKVNKILDVEKDDCCFQAMVAIQPYVYLRNSQSAYSAISVLHSMQYQRAISVNIDSHRKYLHHMITYIRYCVSTIIKCFHRHNLPSSSLMVTGVSFAVLTREVAVLIVKRKLSQGSDSPSLVKVSKTHCCIMDGSTETSTDKDV